MRYLISTSKNPSRYTRSFAKDLERVLPNAYYLTRGKLSLDSIFEFASVKGYDVVVLIGEYHGNPATLEFYDPQGQPRGLALRVKGVKLMREFPLLSEAEPYSASTVISVSAGFKTPFYAKLLSKISGLEYVLDISKSELLKKHSFVANLEPTKDRECIFKIVFYTLTSNSNIIATGPVIKVMGFL
jgi:rRNA maturation protein Rpf1